MNNTTFTVTHACGHTEEHTAPYGAPSEGKIARLSEQICSACGSEVKKSQIVGFVSEKDMVALVGSEKQIAWADSIRGDFFKSNEIVSLASVLTSNKKARSKKRLEARVPAIAGWGADELDKALTALMAVEDSSFFIDNKNNFFLDSEYQLDAVAKMLANLTK